MEEIIKQVAELEQKGFSKAEAIEILKLWQMELQTDTICSTYELLTEVEAVDKDGNHYLRIMPRVND